MFSESSLETGSFVEDALRGMLDRHRDVISAIRYYTYDPVASALHSACSVDERESFSVSPRATTRYRSNARDVTNEPFLVIDQRIPILFSINSNQHQSMVTDGQAGAFIRVELKEDPCPWLDTGSPETEPRQWCDIPIFMPNGQSIGKLSCDLKPRKTAREPYEERVGYAISDLCQMMVRDGASLECAFSRLLYLPFMDIQSRIQEQNTYMDVCEFCATQLHQYMQADAASMYEYERDESGAQRLLRVASTDPYATACAVEHSETVTARAGAILTDEQSVLFMSASKQHRIQIAFPRVDGISGFGETEFGLLTLSDSFQLNNGRFGATLVAPLIVAGETRFVLVLRKYSSTVKHCFLERDLSLFKHICERILPEKLSSLRGESFAKVIVQQAFDEGGPLASIVDDGDLKELSQDVCDNIRRVIPEGNTAKAYLINILDSSRREFRHVLREGHLVKTSPDHNHNLKDSFTEVVLGVTGRSVMLCDVKHASNQGQCLRTYDGAKCAIGAQIAYAGRVYGAIVIMSNCDDLSTWRHGREIQYIAERTGNMLAMRELLDASLGGLINDVRVGEKSVRRVMKDADDYIRVCVQRQLRVTSDMLRGTSQLIRLDPWVQEKDCRSTNVDDLILDLAGLVLPLAKLTLIEPLGTLVSVYRPLLLAIIYKVVAGLVVAGRPRIEVKCAKTDETLRLTFSIPEKMATGLPEHSLNCSLVDELGDDGTFGGKPYVSLRFAASLLSRMRFRDGRHGTIQVVDNLLEVSVPLGSLQGTKMS